MTDVVGENLDSSEAGRLASLEDVLEMLVDEAQTVVVEAFAGDTWN